MATKTIDIKGLQHTEREALIFPGVDALKPGDALRIVVEFNPVPLAYMLRAKGGIDVAYEKEGPDEWILLVTRVASEEEKRQQFRELLTDLRGGATGSATTRSSRSSKGRAPRAEPFRRRRGAPRAGCGYLAALTTLST